MNVFKTIAIPVNLAAKAQAIAHDLGYPERGMFVSVFSDEADAPVGVMSTGILDSESAILQAEALPAGEREYALSVISSMWTGAAANNLCIIAAIATGGTFAPACLVIGAAVGMQRWEAGANERLFWAICADERTRNPRLTCEFTKPT